MKILVTGGAGFIGSHVCEELLAREDEVVCVDNFNDYYNPRIKERNIVDCLEKRNCRLCRGDILDFSLMRSVFEKENPRKIIHLAARAGIRPSINNPFLYEEVNIRGTLNLLELAKQYGIDNFVFASSSSVYGNRTEGCFKETDMVDKPISPYAACKKAGELFCYNYNHLYDLNCSCLRFFTVYGPRGRPDMAPFKFVDKIARGEEIEIYGEGTSRRDYTYISDIVGGVVAALDKSHKYELFNLGGANPVQLNYFVSLIENNLNKKVKIRYVEKQQGDVEMTFADVSKSREMLGYEPKVSIEEGVRRLVEWYDLVYNFRRNPK
ncbi:GDP-mannose 4,6-dehydratase [Candidatus Woesearchaeota archaeon]|nr:GDP-mannose 4,6-dehydratase [Candidatus Woesearchaeota archaeon]